MSKKALCMPTSAVQIDFSNLSYQSIPLDFFETPTLLCDRAVCETDTSVLQLIPYITLRDQEGRVFMYERGKGGNEDRLKTKLSIGLGGHVESYPHLQTPLEHHLIIEGERELKEEIGLDLTLSYFVGLLWDPLVDVGRVHLGLHAVCELPAGAQLSQEKDVITRGRFVSVKELLEPETFERLENWSKVVAGMLED